MDFWEERSSLTNLTDTEGYFEVMVVMTGLILDSERPVRTRREGRPAAIEIAVSAPIPPWEGPVITTGT
jgi:hypothetical protein